MRVIFLATPAEDIPEILVVFVSPRRFITGYIALLSCRWVHPKSTWGRFWKACSSTIANKVAFAEEFNKSVLAVAGDGAGVADSGGSVRVRGNDGRRAAGET